MLTPDPLPFGVYERLIDEELHEILQSRPDLIPCFGSIEDENEAHSYSQFISQVLRQALPIAAPEKRIALLNRIIALISAEDGLDYTKRKQLLARPEQVLHEIRSASVPGKLPRPVTPFSVSSLLTGSCDDPPLEHELRAEMMSADQVDILISFIKWPGLRLLMPAFEDLSRRRVPVRLVTTSYMGASDPKAIEWLAAQQGFSVKVSFDTERTRLHAKAYHFVRNTGYSTAYIGSANMSHAAMTSGLEWTVKVTTQDMTHILARFAAQFETYWSSEEFVTFDNHQAPRFREAISIARRSTDSPIATFFADLHPYPFQERILDALQAARQSSSYRNLVIAATGTGKTVMAAFDYLRFRKGSKSRDQLLFIAHRKEILEQALSCFRSILRDQNFGELFVGGSSPVHFDHLFASVQGLRSLQSLPVDHFSYIVLDEAHHGTAESYRPLFDHFRPEILLGLTATPERMDGSSILPDFDDRFAAEIRLPEALEEKLLCPFHYFGVADSVDVSGDEFWRNGKYDEKALTQVYTGDDIRASERLDLIVRSIDRYQPDISNTRAVGFCASVAHAEFMAGKFREIGLSSEAITGKLDLGTRASHIQKFRSGEIKFVFTVDLFSEGVNVPEIDLVLFLRPTESLTVFLQQLGRGLRHAPDKDCLTVLDFVGQAHRKYRMDQKISALLGKRRRRIDREIEFDFPNLPPGCNIQLERVAKERIIHNIKQTLGRLSAFIPESIRTFEAESSQDLTFSNFLEATSLSPIEVLKFKTWSEWKNIARRSSGPTDPDLEAARKALCRASLRTDPTFLDNLISLGSDAADSKAALNLVSDSEKAAVHYLLWGTSGSKLGVHSYEESFEKWKSNPSCAQDLVEVAKWRKQHQAYPLKPLLLPGNVTLHLHAAYGFAEVKAFFGKATLEQSGPTGVGVIHLEEAKTYLHFVTFRKEEKDFAPTTRYEDFLISLSRLHWQSQAATTQASSTGQNYIHFKERGYTILFFARAEKKALGETEPFIFLGPAETLNSYEGERPITFDWNLEYPAPAELFEETRVA